MTRSRDRIRPVDLESEGQGLDHEVATAYAVARQLETELLPTEATQPSPDFADRVMAAVAREPRPRSAAFMAPLERRRSLAGLRDSVAAALRIALGVAMPARARATALAYVFAVVLVAGSATTIAAYGAAGALGLFGPSPTVSPSPSRVDATAAPTRPLGEPGESSEPGDTHEPGDSSRPEDGPSAEPDHMSGDEASGAPSATDDATPSSTVGHDDSETPSPTSPSRG